MSRVLICHFVKRRNPSLLLNDQCAILSLLLEGLHGCNSLWYGVGVMQLDSSSGLSGNQADLSVIGAVSAPQSSYPPVAVIKDLLEGVCFAFHWVRFVLLIAKVEQLSTRAFNNLAVSSVNKGLAG